MLFPNDDEPNNHNRFKRLVFMNIYSKYQDSLQ